MKLAVVCCLHGNETYGLEVVKRLPPNISFFVANKRATEQKKRFIDKDMNRAFPGKENGNYEEKEAFKLLKKLKNFDCVIDLHSSSNNCPLFGIITKPSKEKIKLTKKMGLKRLVIMPPTFASGHSLTDFVKGGISLEIGPHKKKENINDVLKLINNFIENKKGNSQISLLEVVKKIKKEQDNILIKNFKKVKKGQIFC